MLCFIVYPYKFPSRYRARASHRTWFTSEKIDVNDQYNSKINKNMKIVTKKYKK